MQGETVGSLYFARKQGVGAVGDVQNAVDLRAPRQEEDARNAQPHDERNQPFQDDPVGPAHGKRRRPAESRAGPLPKAARPYRVVSTALWASPTDGPV